MTEPLGHASIESLLGAYALDAVDGPEAEAVELHLQDCPRCRAEVADHRETAALLGHAGAAAPEGLWDRIAGELEEPPPSLALGRLAVVGDTGIPGQAKGRRHRRISLRPVGAVAAAAAVIIGGLGFELSHLQGQLSSVRAAVQASASSEQPKAILSRLISDALITPGHQVVDLTSGTTGQGAEAVLLPNGRGYLVRTSLPRLPSSQTYQLWAEVGGQLVSVAVLGPVPDQQAFSVGPGAPVAQLKVTVEPRGGVGQPTHPAVVWGNPVSA